jgi:hypothetical protein
MGSMSNLKADVKRLVESSLLEGSTSLKARVDLAELIRGDNQLTAAIVSDLVIREYRQALTIRLPDPEWIYVVNGMHVDAETSIAHEIALGPVNQGHNDKYGVVYDMFRLHAELMLYTVSGRVLLDHVVVSSEKAAMEIVLNPSILARVDPGITQAIIECWPIPTAKLLVENPELVERAGSDVITLAGVMDNYGRQSVLADRDAVRRSFATIKAVASEKGLEAAYVP